MNHLVVDVGNTDMVLGYWDSQMDSPNVLRISTVNIRNNINELFPFLNKAREEFKISPPVNIVLSSVVPDLTASVSRALEQCFQSAIKTLDHQAFHKLPLDILQPHQIGTDLVANALAAYNLFKKTCIIIDFGTALSFTTLSANGKILGVSIAPGLRTALHALTSNAAQLQDVPLVMPESSLGQNTEHAIQAGIMYGYDGLVRGVVQAQEKELNQKLFVIATGGLSRKIHTLQDRIDYYAPHLTLEGLKIAGKLI